MTPYIAVDIPSNVIVLAFAFISSRGVEAVAHPINTLKELEIAYPLLRQDLKDVPQLGDVRERLYREWAVAVEERNRLAWLAAARRAESN